MNWFTSIFWLKCVKAYVSDSFFDNSENIVALFPAFLKSAIIEAHGWKHRKEGNVAMHRFWTTRWVSMNLNFHCFHCLELFLLEWQASMDFNNCHHVFMFSKHRSAQWHFVVFSFQKAAAYTTGWSHGSRLAIVVETKGVHFPGLTWNLEPRKRWPT